MCGGAPWPLPFTSRDPEFPHSGQDLPRASPLASEDRFPLLAKVESLWELRLPSKSHSPLAGAGAAVCQRETCSWHLCGESQRSGPVSLTWSPDARGCAVFGRQDGGNTGERGLVFKDVASRRTGTYPSVQSSAPREETGTW